MLEKWLSSFSLRRHCHVLLPSWLQLLWQSAVLRQSGNYIFEILIFFFTGPLPERRSQDPPCNGGWQKRGGGRRQSTWRPCIGGGQQGPASSCFWSPWGPCWGSACPDQPGSCTPWNRPQSQESDGGCFSFLGMGFNGSPGCKSSSPWCCGPSTISAFPLSDWPCSPGGTNCYEKTSHVKLGLSHRALVRDDVACYQDGDLLGDYVGKVHQRRPVGE